MPQSLEEFVASARTDLERFEAAYKEKAAKLPEQYPLTLPDNNAGLWLEFFITFHTDGTV